MGEIDLLKNLNRKWDCHPSRWREVEGERVQSDLSGECLQIPTSCSIEASSRQQSSCTSSLSTVRTDHSTTLPRSLDNFRSLSSRSTSPDSAGSTLPARSGSYPPRYQGVEHLARQDWSSTIGRFRSLDASWNGTHRFICRWITILDGARGCRTSGSDFSVGYMVAGSTGHRIAHGQTTLQLPPTASCTLQDCQR